MLREAEKIGPATIALFESIMKAKHDRARSAGST
jgi:hypothetical protein